MTDHSPDATPMAVADAPAPAGAVADFPDVLKPAQVCEILGVARITLDRWRAAGEGPPCFRIGTGPNGHVRYRRDRLLAWIEEQEREAA